MTAVIVSSPVQRFRATRRARNYSLGENAKRFEAGNFNFRETSVHGISWTSSTSQKNRYSSDRNKSDLRNKI